MTPSRNFADLNINKPITKIMIKNRGKMQIIHALHCIARVKPVTNSFHLSDALKFNLQPISEWGFLWLVVSTLYLILD